MKMIRYLWWGLFALSGVNKYFGYSYAFFEKVPYLYGSGVIESKFTQFKASIHNLMMTQFLQRAFNKVFETEVNSVKILLILKKVLNKTDFTPAYDSLKGCYAIKLWRNVRDVWRRSCS